MFEETSYLIAKSIQTKPQKREELLVDEDKLARDRGINRFVLGGTLEDIYIRVTSLPYYFDMKNDKALQHQMAMRITQLWPFDAEGKFQSQNIYLPYGNMIPKYLVLLPTHFSSGPFYPFCRVLQYGDQSYVLREALYHAGILKYCWFTSLVKTTRNMNAFPKDEEIAREFTYLHYELNILQPEIILCVGENVEKHMVKITYDRKIIPHPKSVVSHKKTIEEYAQAIKESL